MNNVQWSAQAASIAAGSRSLSTNHYPLFINFKFLTFFDAYAGQVVPVLNLFDGDAVGLRDTEHRFAFHDGVVRYS